MRSMPTTVQLGYRVELQVFSINQHICSINKKKLLLTPNETKREPLQRTETAKSSEQCSIGSPFNHEPPFRVFVCNAVIDCAIKSISPVISLPKIHDGGSFSVMREQVMTREQFHSKLKCPIICKRYKMNAAHALPKGIGITRPGAGI